MTKPHGYQKWQTARVWPGGGWGEALVQVRKDQYLTQRDVAEYVGVSLATLRRWEGGLALPDRSLWPKLEEAMGMPVSDPRVPDHAPAERELIDTMLLMIGELTGIGLCRRFSNVPIIDPLLGWEPMDDQQG